jgi:hypothetical protein
MRALLTALGLCLLVANACSGGEPSPKATTVRDSATPTSEVATRDERAIAESILLTVNDFPTGWAEETQSDEESPFDRCDPDKAPGNLGEAETGDFSDGSDFTLSESVAVFETSAQVGFAIDRVEEVAQCFVEVVDDGDADNAEAEFTDPSFSQLSFPAKGDRSEAYRLKFRVQLRGQSGFGTQGDVFFDLVFVRVGRVGVAIYAFDTFSAPDPDIWERYVDIAVERARTVE